MHFLLFLFLAPRIAVPDSFDKQEWLKQIPDPVCRDKFVSTPEFQLLFTLPKSETENSSEFQHALSRWSSDLLIRIALSLDQDFRIPCQLTSEMEKVLHQVKLAYLKKAGIPIPLKSETVDAFFRVTLTLQEDLKLLKTEIHKTPPTQDALQLVRSLYGSDSQMYQGVFIATRKKAHFETLSLILTEVCAGFNPCLFWDSRWLYRVVISPVAGLAAFVPEISTLVLSESLLERPNRLHRIVILHELAHLAQRAASLYFGRQWLDEYTRVTGWQKDKNGKWKTNAELLPSQRSDELTELSRQSEFSLMPDPVRRHFVFSKSYEESLKRQDPSEDLADHIAVFRYFPERFCFERRRWATEKFDWISKNVFPGHIEPTTCYPG